MSEVGWTELPKLNEDHDVHQFSSGAPELDEWLQNRALKGQLVGNATVFVFARGNRVIGYYALASGGVELASAPGPIKRNAPSPIPVLLLARLAVDDAVQRRGIGRLLLQDALRRSLKVSTEIGFRALLVHSRDESAKAFYLRLAPAFVASPTESLHLMMPLAKMRQVVDGPA